jgi:hypothetical protein
MCSEVLPWNEKTRVARGSLGIEMDSPWLWILIFLTYNSDGFRSKCRVRSDPVGNLRFQGRFRGKRNLMAWEILVKYESPKGFSCRIDLSRFLHPWILCRHRILQCEIWVPKACFQVICPKRIYFPEHFCCCFSSNLCVLNTTNMD